MLGPGLSKTTQFGRSSSSMVVFYRFHRHFFERKVACKHPNRQTFEPTADGTGLVSDILIRLPESVSYENFAVTYLSKMGGSPVNTYQTGFWFWNKNGHDTQTHNDPLNQTGTCLFVGTCRNHGSVGLRTYGFVETLLRHGWVKSMIHDRAQFPYIIKLPQDRVLYELKDLRRRYLTPKINTLNISSEGTTGSIGV